MPDDASKPSFNENFLPTGLDRGGDGNTIWGTPDPSGGIIVAEDGTVAVNGQLSNAQEFSDSPEIERAEQGTITHRFTCSWDDAKLWSQLLGRGVMLQDSEGNYTKVLSSKIQAGRGNVGTVTVVSEYVFQDTPPDEFDLTDVTLNVDIIKHPRYFFALNPTPSESDSSNAGNLITINDITVSMVEIKSAILRAIDTYRHSPFFPSADNVNGLVQNNVISQLYDGKAIQLPVFNETFDPEAKEIAPPVWDGDTATMPDGNWRYALVPVKMTDLSGANLLSIQMAMAAAREIISKLWIGIETPYIAGWQLTHSYYSFRPPTLSPGGYVENPYDDGFGNLDYFGNVLPVANPEVPDYFYSTEFPPDPDWTIFDNLPQLNPCCYSDTGTKAGLPWISWLRQADKIHYERTWYKITRTWIGSPIGHWDSNIFSQKNRPTKVSDYVQTVA